MISLCAYRDSSDKVRYAAVWVQRNGPEWIAFQDLSSSEYQNFFNVQISNGFRPIIITAPDSGSNAIFAGVFEKDSKTSFISLHILTEQQFKQQCESAWNYNLILRWFTVYGPQNNTTYAGIWETNRNKIAWNYSVADDYNGRPEGLGRCVRKSYFEYN
jgi:hypothetical protein